MQKSDKTPAKRVPNGGTFVEQKFQQQENSVLSGFHNFQNRIIEAYFY